MLVNQLNTPNMYLSGVSNWHSSDKVDIYYILRLKLAIYLCFINLYKWLTFRVKIIIGATSVCILKSRWIQYLDMLLISAAKHFRLFSKYLY